MTGHNWNSKYLFIFSLKDSCKYKKKIDYWYLPYVIICHNGNAFHYDVMADALFALLTLWEGDPPVTGGFPSQRASNVKPWCFLRCYLDQTVESLVVWATLMWHHSYAPSPTSPLPRSLQHVTSPPPTLKIIQLIGPMRKIQMQT